MRDPWANENTQKIVPWPVDYDEINLREEMSLLFYGGDGYTPKAHPVIYRRLDRTQACHCVENGSAKTDCKACKGEGYKWNEQIYYTRKRTVYGSGDITADVGIINIREVIYYFEHYVQPKWGDAIFEITYEDNKIPPPPFNRLKRYNIEAAEEFRDLNGRVEYWSCWTELQKIGAKP
jgi:hypothetical protein